MKGGRLIYHSSQARGGGVWRGAYIPQKSGNWEGQSEGLGGAFYTTVVRLLVGGK